MIRPMSDGQLHELERRWRETRSTPDETAWLRERVRAGQLSEARLELAASCGHPAAERACGISSASAAPGLGEMLAGLARFGASESPVAAVAARCATLAIAQFPGQAPEALARAAAAIAEHEQCPCEAHRSALFLLSSQLGRLAATRRQGDDPRAATLLKALYHLSAAINKAAKVQHDPALEQVRQGLEAARRSGLDDAELTEAVRGGLVSWALAVPPPVGR